ncbi:6-phospho-beta-glucosidase [Micropruina sp.]|uniref:family 4 glycosyl hydrolase n=1 Tax=Micropruina sp. TaxID=2737536 RepID=UPI0039E57D88
MKLTIVGGGGFRVPLVHAALLADDLIDEVALLDVDPNRLAVINRVLTAQGGPKSRLRHTLHTDPATALAGSDLVFSALRSGGVEGRVLDERIAAEHGVIGQETVGAGGVSYALRSIPASLELARTVRAVAPRAWLINFTNPAGMVTEALAAVHARVVGICDSPIALARRAAAALDLDPSDTVPDYVGLNHLGWLTALRCGGVDRLPELIADPARLARFEEGRLFGPELIADLGALPNEYLHWFYFRREALAAGRPRPAAEPRDGSTSRGAFLAAQQRRFYADCPADPPAALAAWQAARLERERTYGATNRAAAGGFERDAIDLVSGGYEGVALAIMRAVATDRGTTLILNTPNAGRLPYLPDDAVIEAPCRVDGGGVHPLPLGSLPGHAQGLVTTVKQVERWTIEAATTGSARAARLALTHHPLVDSAAVASALLAAYRTAFPQLAYLR